MECMNIMGRSSFGSESNGMRSTRQKKGKVFMVHNDANAHAFIAGEPVSLRRP